MRFIIIFSVLFLIPNASAKSPAKSANDIAAIETVYQTLGDFSAKFTQTTNVVLVERTVARKGTFQFKKGGKIRIEYEGNGGKTYISDGTTLWIFVPGDDSSIQTFAVNDESVPKEALAFLGGFGKIRKEFIVTESQSFPNAPAGTKSLHLVPRSKIKHYESLDTLFGPDNILAELIVKNTSGNTSSYKFTNVRTNTGLDDEVFTLPAR